jgi:hypothetical protein
MVATVRPMIVQSPQLVKSKPGATVWCYWSFHTSELEFTPKHKAKLAEELRIGFEEVMHAGHR